MYKRLFLFVGFALLAVLLWSLVGRGTTSSFEDADQVVQLRRIGHELLLSAGDTKSRVLPIKKIAPNEYLIEFENEFAFTADSLVAIASRVLDPLGMKKHFIINATAVKTKEVIYSFGWPAEKSQIPCLDRPLPPTHYAINILLADEAAMIKPSRSKTIPAFAAGLLAICLGIFAWRFTRSKTPAVAEEKTPVLNAAFTSIGKFRFFPGQQLLVTNDTTIELTSKETVLLILVALLIASPLAWYFMHEWLQGFAYRTPLNVWIFVAAAAAAIGIALLTVGFQTMKTAMANPVKSLRTE